MKNPKIESASGASHGSEEMHPVLPSSCRGLPGAGRMRFGERNSRFRIAAIHPKGLCLWSIRGGNQNRSHAGRGKNGSGRTVTKTAAPGCRMVSKADYGVDVSAASGVVAAGLAASGIAASGFAAGSAGGSTTAVGSSLAPAGSCCVAQPAININAAAPAIIVIPNLVISFSSQRVCLA